ncbi:unnamed protein product, partial [Choristocarpus tenellus]
RKALDHERHLRRRDHEAVISILMEAGLSLDVVRDSSCIEESTPCDGCPSVGGEGGGDGCEREQQEIKEESKNGESLLQRVPLSSETLHEVLAVIAHGLRRREVALGEGSSTGPGPSTGPSTGPGPGTGCKFEALPKVLPQGDSQRGRQILVGAHWSRGGEEGLELGGDT